MINASNARTVTLATSVLQKDVFSPVYLEKARFESEIKEFKDKVSKVHSLMLSCSLACVRMCLLHSYIDLCVVEVLVLLGMLNVFLSFLVLFI